TASPITVPFWSMKRYPPAGPRGPVPPVAPVAPLGPALPIALRRLLESLLEETAPPASCLLPTVPGLMLRPSMKCFAAAGPPSPTNATPRVTSAARIHRRLRLGMCRSLSIRTRCGRAHRAVSQEIKSDLREHRRSAVVAGEDRGARHAHDRGVLAAVGAHRRELVAAQAVDAAVAARHRRRAQPRLVAARALRAELDRLLAHAPALCMGSVIAHSTFRRRVAGAPGRSRPCRRDAAAAAARAARRRMPVAGRRRR